MIKITKPTMQTFDFDGVLTNPKLVHDLFLPAENKLVVTSRDYTPQNFEEISAITGGLCDILMCGGFMDKCQTLAELVHIYNADIIHYDDDPAIQTFFKYTNCGVEVKLVKGSET